MDGILGLDREALDRARISRDPRFDGKFFIAVTSTGIYCRPICPSRSSNPANVRYYPTAAAAAEAGFRPCLRCRPEAAPGTPAWLGTSGVVRRALRLIEEGALDETSVDALAGALGIGARHLRRLFLQHVGASPRTVALTRRLHFAKSLLDDTSLPITQVALAAGFRSVRRFNAVFQRVYRRAPRELRRQRGGPAEEVALRLPYHPPYDWEQVRDCLAARALPGVERVDERGWARAVAVAGGWATVRVRPLAGEPALELAVRGAPPGALFALSAAARRMFDLAADPARIALAFEGDPLLGPLVRARPGLRIAGAWDPFECALRAVLGDRAVAALALRRGRRVAGDGLTHLFPSPAELDVPLARAVARGALDLGDVDALAALAGHEVAQLVALLALGEPDAFPAGDPLLRDVAARADGWRPWRGYAAFHLWRAADNR